MNERDFPSSLPTNVGYAADGENYFMGYAVAADLMQQDIGFWSLMSLSVGHRLLSLPEQKQLSDLNVSVLATDPRIWPHKLVRLAASYGSVEHAIAAVANFSHGALVGPGALADSAQFYYKIKCVGEQIGLDKAIGQVVQQYVSEKRPIPSFGTPMRKVDERCIALDASRKRQGIQGGEYWHLYKAVTRYVEEQKSVKVNASGPTAAIFLDLGFSVEQIHSVSIALVSPVWLAHAQEGSAQAPKVLQCLPDELIDYQGPAARISPRQQIQRS